VTIRVACLGDSITHAQVSVDYLEPLARRHRTGALVLFRFGVNGNFAYNLLQRLDPVIASSPDVITVLIGTNDARASLTGYPAERAMKRKQLPTRPSPAWYQECLLAVVERLRAETDAQVGLLSLPVLGLHLHRWALWGPRRRGVLRGDEGVDLRGSTHGGPNPAVTAELGRHSLDKAASRSASRGGRAPGRRSSVPASGGQPLRFGGREGTGEAIIGPGERRPSSASIPTYWPGTNHADPLGRFANDVVPRVHELTADHAHRPTGSQRMTEPTDTTTAETDANREIVRRAFDAWQHGTGAVTDVFASDMVWRIEGHSLASREYGSRQEFIDEVLAPFGARFTTPEPFRPTRIRSIHADGDTVIVVWDGRGVANDGRPYQNSYAWIMRLANGKVVDGTAFYDSISFNDLWTRVQP
jgi:ketosteroid isomerase-like protein